jgi:hypothetical protein
MLGFKDFDSAHVIPSGIEVMHMIKKGQLNCWAKAHCLPPSSVLARTFYPKKSHLYFAVNRNLLFYKEKHR